MPATLNEQTQFVDDGGKPLVNGKVYFGVQNADPELNPVSVFSDRALSVAIANPQLLDADGRTANKVWVAGRYSMRVDDLNNVQKYQELDNGESPDVGVTALENVTGGNTIVAEATSTISAYEDLELYAFRTAQANTTAVTLNIDGVGAKSIVKNHDQAILNAEFEADQNIIVSYNLTDDVFEWVNQNNKVIDFYEGSDVVSAATADIWATDGNTVHLTGATGPVTSLGTAPNVGAVRWVVCDSTPTFTHSANLNLPGAVDFTAAAGDLLRVYADTTTQIDVQIFKADGESIVPSGVIQTVSSQTGAVATTTTTMPADDTIPQNTEGGQFLTLAITPTDVANILEIDVVMFLSWGNGSIELSSGLFQDSTVNAIAAAQVFQPITTQMVEIVFRHRMVAGTISATTFNVRAGARSAGTLTFNGTGGTRELGGVLASSITITEKKP